MAFTEALEVYPIINRISEHFKNHHYLTKDDFEKLVKDAEHLNEVRRSLLEIEGEADLVIIDTTDLP